MIFLLFSWLIACLAAVTFGVLFFDLRKKFLKTKKERDDLQTVFDSARDIQSQKENIIQKAKETANTLIVSAQGESARINNENTDLKSRGDLLLKEIRNLEQKLSVLRDEDELASVAFYEKHYSFENAIDFERAIAENRREQKVLLQNAVSGETGNKKLDSLLRKMVVRTINSECDYYIKCVDYKNVITFENRIRNTFESIGKLIDPLGLHLSNEVYEAKLQELRLIYEFQEKKIQLAEEERRAKEILRDEIKAEREIEKAKQDNEKEMNKFEHLLERAVAMAEKAKGEELDKLNTQISVLKMQLEEAKEKERKLSMAQQTKAGYVYVISNIGSFGQDVYKIGMTRRLEPQERIDELGDASVPFPFDVHALIWHENAPELEHSLHQIFEQNRVNKINPRKEFFKVDLKRIEEEARKVKADIVFQKYAEAKEYRQGLNM